MSLSITLRELAAASNVSASHLGRIERGECFPSAHVLQRISDPLGFKKTSFLPWQDTCLPNLPRLPKGILSTKVRDWIRM
ncbi:MAG: helix-turn-helix transcriptional regulator [Dehalococcoidales bacterium]|nr:helix-turn-helix transcriptional regulator [Dehalococcoidales bacterium]